VVSVDASASAGEVTVFGRKDDGVDAHVSENSISPGALQSGTVKTIQIDTHVGLGNVSVSRIPR
jgi:predicted membrane protein